MATPRSPRSIERLFGSTTLSSLTAEQTALLLSLAQCTGWSADRIRLQIYDLHKVSVKAEDIYDFHWQWVLRRGKGWEVSVEEKEIMLLLLREVGVVVKELGRPLNRTMSPTTVDYKNSYSPKNDAGLPLVHNFTILTRTLSKEYLSQQPKTKFGLLSPAEEPIVNHFGEPISIIMKDCLKRWARAMRVKLKGDPDIRPIREREHVNLIMEYLNVFQEGYEAVFGTMERNMHSPLGQIKDNTVHIRSTGYAAKVFLGLLMADRLHVVEKLRREERERIGFVEMDEGEVEADSKNCPVCQDPMGVENPEGEKESPIRLVICCGQVIGENCMKQWLSEFAYEGAQRDSCPVCRFQFPESFMRTLFDTEDDEQSSDGDEDVELGNADDDEEYADRGIPDAQPTELIDLISDEDVEVPDAQPREVINLVSPLPSPLRHRNSRARSTPAVLYSAVDLTRLVFQNSAHVDDGAYRGPSWGLMMAEADVMEDDARMLEG